jgi:hypothetical protein
MHLLLVLMCNLQKLNEPLRYLLTFKNKSKCVFMLGRVHLK